MFANTITPPIPKSHTTHEPAVELAEAHNFPQIEALLTKYAQHLLEKNRVMQVRCVCALYRLLVVCGVRQDQSSHMSS
jgi:hypothetical protein